MAEQSEVSILYILHRCIFVWMNEEISLYRRKIKKKKKEDNHEFPAKYNSSDNGETNNLQIDCERKKIWKRDEMTTKHT